MHIVEILIGAVQGITEFLPVSSSGHIAVLEHWFGVFSKDLSREVALHLATLLAVFLYFRRKIWNLLLSWMKGEKLNYLLYLVVGSIPAGLLGLLGEKSIESAFASLFSIGIFFLITSFILFSTRWAKVGRKELNVLRSFLVGMAQAFAIFPGISRSGATISAGLHLGISPEEAFEFSFLLSIPAILGAGVLEAIKVSPSGILAHWQGIIAAFITGYFSLYLLGKIIKRGKLWVFAPYLLLLSLLIFFKGG